MRERKLGRTGFTTAEVLVVLGILGVVFLVVTVAIRPDEIQKRSRDAKRMADLGRLASGIENYVAEHGRPPDLPNVRRESNLSFGGASASSRGQGWIEVDLSKYLENLPLDPLNDVRYRYRYQSDGLRYEVDAKLEHYLKEMEDDGGNDSSWLEKGTDLGIL